MKCPNCDCRHLFQSRSGTARLIWPLRLFLVAIRCYGCHARFVRLHRFWGGEAIRQRPAFHETRLLRARAPG
jgi:hypothetical protein